MNSLRSGLLFFACLGLASAATPPNPPAEKSAARPAEKKSEWVFSLLPKSLQSNPRLELTVITEMTEAGRKLPLVSPDKPAYFETFTLGAKHLGHVAGNQVTLKPEEIERVLLRALATNGYQPAKPPAHPPSLLINYTWGSHNMLVEGDDENPVNSGQMLARNMLDRAALVGGDKFARELLRLFEEADSMAAASRVPTPPDGNPVLTPEMMAFANPVEMFKRRAPKNEALVDQTAGDVYYVVASAYDYKALAANRRVLLWRTRMTVASAGVSPEQSMPTMVLSAAPFFGKEMAEAEVLSKRSMREGNVEVGAPKVVEGEVKAPPAQKKK